MFRVDVGQVPAEEVAEVGKVESLHRVAWKPEEIVNNARPRRTPARDLPWSRIVLLYRNSKPGLTATCSFSVVAFCDPRVPFLFFKRPLPFCGLHPRGTSAKSCDGGHSSSYGFQTFAFYRREGQVSSLIPTPSATLLTGSAMSNKSLPGSLNGLHAHSFSTGNDSKSTIGLPLAFTCSVVALCHLSAARGVVACFPGGNRITTKRKVPRATRATRGRRVRFRVVEATSWPIEGRRRRHGSDFSELEELEERETVGV